MIFKVVLLDSAERDLKGLRKYLIQRFSMAEWTVALKTIRHTLGTLAQYPLSGHPVDPLNDPAFQRFRQSIAGMNRIVYEVRGDTVYVYAILDTRRSYVELLRRRAGDRPRS